MAVAELETAVPPPAGEDWSRGVLVLPSGVLDADGVRRDRVRLRELTGADEERLADRGYPNAAEQVTDFLARVVQEFVGWAREVDRELVAGLPVGDRDYLILRARQMSLGDRVHQVMTCPAAACGEKVDVEFLISELPVRRAETLEASYPLELSRPAFDGDESSKRGSFRLATGHDQAAIAELVESNPARANTRLFSRVVLTLGRRRGLDEESARALPLAVRREIADQIRSRSPGPDLEIDVRCPHCGADMGYPFDLANFFFDELAMTVDGLYREVHCLAFHYHWPESEILTMTRHKRRRYLALLGAQLEGAA